MNRQSLAVQAEISQAAQAFVKEIKRLRTQHGFGHLKMQLDDDGKQCDMELQLDISMELNFDGDGNLEGDDWKQQNLNGGLTHQEP